MRMRAPLSIAGLAAAVLVISASARQDAPRASVAITGVTVIDAAGNPPFKATVLLDGERIAAIDRREPAAPADAQAIDGRGKFLVPALWDMHLHLGLRPEPRIAETIALPLLLAHGVVGVRDMGGPSDALLALRARVASGELAGPRILTAGPFLDGPGDASPMFRRIASAADARQAVEEIGALGVDFVKIQSGLMPEAHAAIIGAARARGLAAVGHVPVSMTASAVARSGQRTIEHISPALVGDAGLLFACSREETALHAELVAIEQGRGTVAAPALARRERALRRRLVDTYDPARARAFGALLSRQGVSIVPTLIWSARLRPLSRTEGGRAPSLDYVPSATRAQWTARRAKYLEAVADEDLTLSADVARASAAAVRALHEGGATVLAGTDAFDAFVVPGVSLHEELALLSDAGLPPLAVLQAATFHAARARGTEGTEGSIAVGKRADLLLLDADPLHDPRNLGRIAAVIAGGVIRSREALDSLLDRVRNAARQP